MKSRHPDRHVEVKESAAVPALAEVDCDAVAIGGKIVQIEPNRLVKVEGRPAVIALPVVGDAALEVGADIVRIEGEYAITRGNMTIHQGRPVEFFSASLDEVAKRQHIAALSQIQEPMNTAFLPMAQYNGAAVIPVETMCC